MTYKEYIKRKSSIRNEAWFLGKRVLELEGELEDTKKKKLEYIKKEVDLDEEYFESLSGMRTGMILETEIDGGPVTFTLTRTVMDDDSEKRRFFWLMGSRKTGETGGNSVIVKYYIDPEYRTLGNDVKTVKEV